MVDQIVPPAKKTHSFSLSPSKSSKNPNHHRNDRILLIENEERQLLLFCVFTISQANKHEIKLLKHLHLAQREKNTLHVFYVELFFTLVLFCA